MEVFDDVVQRLKFFGFILPEEDEDMLDFTMGKTEQAMLDICNIEVLPESLRYVLVDRTVGEFLMSKRTVSGDGLLENVNLEMMASQIKEGDVTISFGAGSDLSPSARLDQLINAFRVCGKNQLARYRRLAW